jgi:hypothetical protein
MWLQKLNEALEALGQEGRGAKEGVGGRVHTELQESHTEHQLKMIDIQNKVEGIKVWWRSCVLVVICSAESERCLTNNVVVFCRTW